MNKYLKWNFLALINILIFSAVPVVGHSEETASSPVEISFGTIKTEAEQAAVGVLIKYVEKIDEEYFISNAGDIEIDEGRGWLLDITPEVELQTGEADSFNGLIAKLTANYIAFDTIKISGIETPDTSKSFSVYPMSIGIESNRNFENVSLLAEAGYLPFNLKSKWRLGLDTKVGAFLQAGYKFETDKTPEVTNGGAMDESAESPNSGIARVKIDAGSEVLKYSYSKGKSISLIPRARLWYDFYNSEVYHKIEVKLLFSLGKDKSFDFKYENGSGAPNFNEGEQFSANLTISY